jgi:hypothetical protein
MAEAKWKRFEKIIHEIHSQLAPQGAVVTHNEKIVGHESGVERQLDITIRITVANYPLLIVVECKDEARPIDVSVIGEFASSLTDVKANKGVLISSAGFTPGAINMARNRGIETRTYLDTGSIDWRSEVAIPVLVRSTILEAWNVTFESLPGHHCPGLPGEDLHFLEVFDTEDKHLGWVITLFGRKWMHDSSLQEVGIHSVVIAEHAIARFRDAQSHVRITARLRVAHRTHLGPLPISAKGLLNDQDGSFTTNQFKTAPIDTGAISRGKVPGWREVTDPAVRAVLTMDVMDALPETAEEFHRYRHEPLTLVDDALL